MTRLATFVAVLVLSMAHGCAAQNYTWQQDAFNNATTTGVSPVFRNTNASSHFLTYLANNNVVGIKIQLEGCNAADCSPVSANWQAISSQGTSLPGGIVYAGGYFPNVRAHIVTLQGASGSVTAYYSSASSAITPPPGAGTPVSSQPVTFAPVVGSTSTLSATAPAEFVTSPSVLYGATVTNPNAGIVYFGFSTSDPTGTGPTQANVLVAIPAAQSTTVLLPTQGIFMSPQLWYFCTTSLLSFTNPGTPCQFNIYYKQSATSGGMVN